jgi:predicted transcriptional regulator
MEQSGPGTEVVEDGKSGSRRLPNAGTLGISDARWAEAHRRAAVIEPLAALESVSAPAARDAGRTLGRSERTIYRLLRLWQKSGGLVSSLAPRPAAAGRGKGRLTAAAVSMAAPSPASTRSPTPRVVRSCTRVTTAKLRLAQAAMGKAGTKVGELCAELGISRQTLYRHVTPKGELGPDGLALLARRRTPAASQPAPAARRRRAAPRSAPQTEATAEDFCQLLQPSSETDSDRHRQ